jgi:hypothetical protein
VKGRSSIKVERLRSPRVSLALSHYVAIVVEPTRFHFARYVAVVTDQQVNLASLKLITEFPTAQMPRYTDSRALRFVVDDKNSWSR